MQKFEYTDQFGHKFNLSFYKASYVTGNLAIEAVWDGDGYDEPYADVTVNLGGAFPKCAYLDTNNCDHIIKWMVEKGFVRLTGHERASGYCTYPLGEFTDGFLAGCGTYEEG